MNHEKVYNRIVASYATGIRGDLVIADFQKFDNATAHVLMEYGPHLGRPKGEDIERYFAKTFEGRIVPIMSSVTIKPKAISVIARLNVPTRPMEDGDDKTKMFPIIAGLMYLDNNLGEHWEVKESDGKKTLAKVSKDNIDQIIAARRNRMFVTQSPSISLSSLATARDLLIVGDVVKAFTGDEMITAEITAKVKGGYRVKSQKTDKEMTIAADGITDVTEISERKAPNETAKLVKYFEDAYGSKSYARELVKGD